MSLKARRPYTTQITNRC